jgi:hypothetical protein
MKQIQIQIAKNWKNASILDGILASKRMTLQQSYDDFVACQKSSPEYVKNTLALLEAAN